MTISVTADLIARGVPGDPDWCPVALALRAATSRHWVVGPEFCWCGMSRVSLPEVVELFVTRFDAGEPVEPFSFEFEPTQPVPVMST